MKVGEFLNTVLRPYGIDVILSISANQLSIFDVSCMYGYKPNKVAGDYIIYMVVPAIERRYVATIFDFYVVCDAKTDFDKIYQKLVYELDVYKMVMM